MTAAATIQTPADFASWRQLPPGIEVTNVEPFLQWADEVSDPRVRDWPLMNSIWPTLIMCTAYFTFAFFGKRIMKNREAFDLRHTMTIYNVSVILLNGWLFVSLIKHVLQQQYALLCNPVDYGPEGTDVAWLIYVYYLSKALDFSDTVFMVLRKKWDQLTFLHCYHHGLMFIIWWSAVKYAAGGNAVVGPIMNTFIHFTMYMYYLASTFGVKIPGKRYLTQMQMTQLFILLQHSAITVISDCAYPHWTQYTQLSFMVTLLILFGNFYVQSYLKGRKSKSSRRTPAAATPTGGASRSSPTSPSPSSICD